jgi:hypothetical protein
VIPKLADLLVILVFVTSVQLHAQQHTRYFKEDHGTGAEYLTLSPNGTYRVTNREHMGVWQGDSGHWKKTGTQITFTQDKGDKKTYTAQEVNYRNKTFLSFSEEGAPTIPIPIDETKKQLDDEPKYLPPYVFFETNRALFLRETGQSYPFKFIKPQVNCTATNKDPKPCGK